MVGESMGHKLSGGKQVIVAIGMGDFSSNKSRHVMFIRYLIRKLRPLGYTIVGVNEYYTSKKCPCCMEFVEMPAMRRLYCRRCNKWYHRDVMAADNMVNIVRGYLEHDERPTYLKPPSKNKNTPMKRKADEGGGLKTREKVAYGPVGYVDYKTYEEEHGITERAIVPKL
ncbi:hypothetical protein SeMB42_g01653 [Synchytrium endobioticum]|uniref:Cas12f1-like TNB domain-containing protein n=1 Tax=Synchytrium endobioticum TaxID=286115 RepID=A0A507DK85_9FUNG|nr:hypothetical protein SeMB42_g01653 [Synchytrium endobioticum]